MRGERENLCLKKRVWNRNPSMSGSFSNWEARHVCGFEVLFLFGSNVVTWCDQSMKDFGLARFGNEKCHNKSTDDQSQSFLVGNPAVSLFYLKWRWSLTSSEFISWRPHKRPTWKKHCRCQSLAVQKNCFQICHATQVFTNIFSCLTPL